MERWRVLIVEDEHLLGRAMCDVLSDHHDVEHVGSVAAARTRLGQGGIDVVLCDVQLPDGTGGDVRAAYGATAPGGDARFVLITGGDEALAHRLGGGAGRVLRKPFDLDDLPSLLAGLVGG